MRIEQVMILSVAAVFANLAVGEERPPFPENPTPPGLVGVPEYSPGPNVDPKESRYWKMSKDVVTYDSRSDR